MRIISISLPGHKNKLTKRRCYFLVELDTEKLRTEAILKEKNKKKTKEKQQVAAAVKLEKDKTGESRQENKHSVPKEVSKIEIMDCDQNIAKEKKRRKNFSKEPKFSLVM